VRVLGGQEWLNGWPAGESPWAQLKIVNFSSATQRLRDTLIQVLEFCEDRTIADLAHDR